MHIPDTFEDLLVNDPEDLEVKDVESTQAHKLVPLVHLVGLTCKITDALVLLSLTEFELHVLYIRVFFRLSQNLRKWGNSVTFLISVSHFLQFKNDTGYNSLHIQLYAI